MGWRDLLYFSRGERRALCLLLAIVAGGWGLMVWMDHQSTNQPPAETGPQQVAPDDTIPTAVTTADTVITPQAGRRPTTPLRAKRAPIDRRIREYRYPPRESNKFPEGTIVDLNRADSLTLQRVPGIGPAAFARSDSCGRSMASRPSVMPRSAPGFGPTRRSWSAAISTSSRLRRCSAIPTSTSIKPVPSPT